MPNLESSSGRPCLQSSVLGFKVPFSQELPSPPWLAVGQGPFCTWIPAQASPGLSLQSSWCPRPPSFCCLLLPTWTSFGKQEAHQFWGGLSLAPAGLPPSGIAPAMRQPTSPTVTLSSGPAAAYSAVPPSSGGNGKEITTLPSRGLTQGLGAGGRRREQGPRGGQVSAQKGRRGLPAGPPLKFLFPSPFVSGA